ncbi:hypothetical protein B0H13DRAFT_2324356 [Mycena leptocephala]|nr:hypothetical protein B0H13DRAFT_2324356 [Mycena leptocephala]
MKLSTALALAMALSPTAFAFAAPFEINIGSKADSGDVETSWPGLPEPQNAATSSSGPAEPTFVNAPSSLAGRP